MGSARLFSFRGVEPRVDPTAYIAPGAVLIGDVHVGPGASIWCNAVLRGDKAPVRVGANTNVQDAAVLHADPGSPCLVGSDSTVAHGAVVHGCVVGDSCLIGMGALVLNDVEIAEESLVAAGAVVVGGTRFERRSLIAGVPARRTRELGDEDVDRLIRENVRGYVDVAQAYRGGALEPLG